MSWNSRKDNRFTNIILVLICIVLIVILGSLLLTNHKEVKQESERLEKLSQKQETGIDDYEAVKEHASELKEEADEEDADSSKKEEKAEADKTSSDADESTENGKASEADKSSDADKAQSTDKSDAKAGDSDKK